ncbi:nuclear receptor subfamily 0 group B member 2a [Trichomycterus rosablanca]|uniref:nuclear receptor subfamily 0 group B member 2a n=1 Tax=Trichomycterus rosablanca TaxID=2290929 RepID=UPI002F3525CB
METECGCMEETGTHAILFTILTGDMVPTDPTRSPRRCHCTRGRSVRLKNRDTSLVAAGVLVKTVRFVRSLPAFQQLPPEDQLALIQHSWAPLLVLGLAQERVSFEVEQEPAPSMLRKILLEQQQARERRREYGAEQPTLAGVQNLKSCLRKLWSLDLSPKEYAYLKGTMIFNPDVPGLQVAPFVDALQREAQRALKEVLFLLHDDGSFGRVLLATSSLRSVTPELITELFFRPIIGSAHLLQLISDMLFSR